MSLLPYFPLLERSNGRCPPPERGRPQSGSSSVEKTQEAALNVFQSIKKAFFDALGVAKERVSRLYSRSVKPLVTERQGVSSKRIEENANAIARQSRNKYLSELRRSEGADFQELTSDDLSWYMEKFKERASVLINKHLSHGSSFDKAIEQARKTLNAEALLEKPIEVSIPSVVIPTINSGEFDKVVDGIVTHLQIQFVRKCKERGIVLSEEDKVKILGRLTVVTRRVLDHKCGFHGSLDKGIEEAIKSLNWILDIIFQHYFSQDYLELLKCVDNLGPYPKH